MSTTDEARAYNELVVFMHSRNEFDYDQCQHGTYTGGPSNGEPFAMCERQAVALLAAGYRKDSEVERLTAQLQAAQQTIEHVTAEYRQERADSLALLRQSTAAQATVAEALACIEEADQGDSFGPIEDILSRADLSTLAEHDKHVAAKALKDAADAYSTEALNLKPGNGWGSNAADSQTISFAVASEKWLRARAASIEQTGAER